jgi:putative RNA 2'-phosphotransferase
MSDVRTSKFLSLVLRHDPARIGITLDGAGWTDVAALLTALAAHGHPLTRRELERLVASSDKQRFALSADGTRIRANQGHSVTVDLQLPPRQPPARLYHGTVGHALAGIRAEGLQKRKRHHVHLSADLGTATKVGSRRGAPLILTVRAAEMAAAGHVFYRSENGVWLTDSVPARFVDFPGALSGALPGAREDEESSPPERRALIAKTTVAACEAGSYLDDGDEDVALQPALGRAVAGTRLYEQAPALPPLSAPPAGAAAASPRMLVEVTDETTNEAIYRLGEAARGEAAPVPAPHLACLNFASAKHPGGRFLEGAQAQEEALARTSGLYPCLLAQPSFYERNVAFGSELYLDLMMWSPRVPFFREDDGGWLDAPVLASVITAPAPNASALRHAGQLDPTALRAAFERRTRMILAMAAAEGVTHLILGAWGAGVFGNDPGLVADVFAAALDELGPRFVRVTFAIPRSGPNHAAFARRFTSR